MAGGRLGGSERLLRRLLGLQGGEETLYFGPDVSDAGEKVLGALVLFVRRY